MLLSGISPWLYSLILEQTIQEEITIISPDVESKNVNNLLRSVETNLFNDTSIDPIIDKSTFETLLKQNAINVIPFCNVFKFGIKDEDDNKKDEQDHTVHKIEDTYYFL